MVLDVGVQCIGDGLERGAEVGGDSDTIAAIAGGIAGAYYGVPDDLRTKALTYLPEDLKSSRQSSHSGGLSTSNPIRMIVGHFCDLIGELLRTIPL